MTSLAWLVFIDTVRKAIKVSVRQTIRPLRLVDIVLVPVFAVVFLRLGYAIDGTGVCSRVERSVTLATALARVHVAVATRHERQRNDSRK